MITQEKIDEYIRNFVKAVARKCVVLCQYHQKRTVTSKEIMTYINLFFPENMCDSAKSAGTRAVVRGITSSSSSNERRLRGVFENEIRIVEESKNLSKLRISPWCIVFLEAVVGYLIQEIMDVSERGKQLENDPELMSALALPPRVVMDI